MECNNLSKNYVRPTFNKTVYVYNTYDRQTLLDKRITTELFVYN